MLDFFFVPYICLAENGIKSFFLQKPYGEIPLFLGRAGKNDLSSTLTQPPSHTEAEPRRSRRRPSPLQKSFPPAQPCLPDSRAGSFPVSSSFETSLESMYRCQTDVFSGFFPVSRSSIAPSRPIRHSAKNTR